MGVRHWSTVEVLDRPTQFTPRASSTVAWCALVAVFLAGMRGLMYRVRLQFGDVDGSLLDDRATQVMFYALYAVALAVGWRFRGTLDRRVVAPLAALVGVLAVSTVWSIEWGRTLNQSLQMALATAAVVMLASGLRIERVLWALVTSGAIATGFSVIAAALDWEFSSDRRGRLTGVFYNRNALGLVAAVLALAALLWWWQRRESARVRVAAAVLVVVALVVWSRSGSATAMIAAVSGVLAASWMAAWQRGSSDARRRLGWVAVGVGVFVVVAVLARGVMAEWIGRDATFTGRTSTWGVVVDAWQRRPIGGFGFFAGWFDPDVRAGLARIDFNHWEAHNGYLEVLMGAGVIGALALAWLLVVVVRAVRRRRDHEWAPTWTALAVFALVSNIGETNIAANRLVWFVLVAVLATVGARDESPAPAVSAG